MEGVNAAVQRCLPGDATVTRVIPWGSSGWTQTMRVTTERSDGTQQEYFLKDCNIEVAHDMFKGEYFSLKTMHDLMPSSCPKPVGWGQYDDSPDTYFLIMEFLYLIAEHPDPDKITDLLVGLHKTTQGTSPENKFGFYVPTCHGKVVQPNEWNTSWSAFFDRLVTVFYDADMAANGSFPDYEEAFATLREKVIPRLLGALQEEGRTLIPCLIHGDLWQENIGINEETEEPMLYDPALFYGHNEFEMGMWRTSFVPFDETYRMQYTTKFKASEPVDEWEDRNRLYSIFYHLSHSAHWHGAADETRLRTLNDMQFLINRYAIELEPVSFVQEDKVPATVTTSAAPEYGSSEIAT
jgi:protein-ribulosamine 3-kinase